MSTRNLDKIFKPESIALIGASDTKGKLGNTVFRNLIDGGFEGPIYPVNPKHKAVLGLKAYKSVNGIKDTVDLAIIVTPIEVVPSLIKDCGIKGIRGAIIISAGGKEAGKEGEKIGELILRESQKNGVRIIGPNCLGIIVPSFRLNASFAQSMALPGNLAFISQSGALCTAILDMSLKENIGFSHFISIGSMADVDFGDLIDYLGSSEEVKSIILYVESLTNAKKFMSAARALSRIKPIIALKSGRSQAGAKAAASHTGAMAGEDDVYDAAFKRAGILRVDSINELFNCAESLAKQPMPKGPSLGIITNAGGPGVMAADKLEALGYKPAVLSEETISLLDSVLPNNWSKGNPADIIGDATLKRYMETVRVCLEADEIDGLLIILTPQAVTNPSDVARGISKICKGKPKPIFAVWMGGIAVEPGIAILNKAGIPTYRSPEEAVNIFVRMFTYDYNLQLLQETPRELHTELSLDRKQSEKIIKKSLRRNHTLLSEPESKQLLESYGIPVNEALISNSPEHAAKLAGDIGFPVVLKVHSADITHKTEAGGVILNINSEKEAEVAYKKIICNAEEYNRDATIIGVTVQRMIEEPGYEIILGSKYDRLFGPVILFGMGGVMAELIGDKSVGIPPLNTTLAKRLMEGTKVYKLISGFRNRPSVNLKLLEEILIRLSHLVTDFPEIEEVDINPLFVNEKSMLALDARIVIKETSLKTPEHMVIAPYPSRYETHWKTKGGIPILFRPIKPDDEYRMIEFFNTFSDKTILFRFFEILKSMPHRQIVRYTQIDYDREMAIVAVEETNKKQSILGVGRLNYYPNFNNYEFAVVVGDSWQRRGLGTKLIQNCIDIARERGVTQLWGEIMVGNKGMIRLCKRLGFKIEWHCDEGIAKAIMKFN